MRRYYSFSRDFFIFTLRINVKDRDMYEKEIQFITDYNLNKINNLGSSFTIEKLVDLELHPAIIKYISGELDYLIYKDRKILLENSSFDYSGEKLSGYFNSIAEELKKSKKLSFEEVKKFVEKAVAFNVNYIIHPVPVLINLIFRNNEAPKNAAEIKAYLNYIYYYDYLRDILNSYFVKRKLLSFNRMDFELTIKKINNELLLQKEEVIIGDAIDSIADFYNDGAVNKSSVPVNLIETYLKGKNLDEYNTRLNKVYRNSKKVDINELKTVLFSVSVSSNLKKEKPLESGKPKDKTFETTSDKNKADQKSAIEEEIIEGQDEIEEMKTGKETSEGNETDELVEEVSTARKTRFKKDIFGFLSKKEIEKIIGTIFNDDREDFTSTMEKLEECNNYDQASEILKAVFFTYRINPYNKEAVALTDAVSDYFHQVK